MIECLVENARASQLEENDVRLGAINKSEWFDVTAFEVANRVHRAREGVERERKNERRPRGFFFHMKDN